MTDYLGVSVFAMVLGLHWSTSRMAIGILLFIDGFNAAGEMSSTGEPGRLPSWKRMAVLYCCCSELKDKSDMLS